MKIETTLERKGHDPLKIKLSTISGTLVVGDNTFLLANLEQLHRDACDSAMFKGMIQKLEKQIATMEADYAAATEIRKEEIRKYANLAAERLRDLNSANHQLADVRSELQHARDNLDHWKSVAESQRKEHFNNKVQCAASYAEPCHWVAPAEKVYQMRLKGNTAWVNVRFFDFANYLNHGDFETRTLTVESN